MIRIVEVVCSPQQAANQGVVAVMAANNAGYNVEDISLARVVRRSVDARAKYPRMRLQVEVFVNELPTEPEKISNRYSTVSPNKRVIIIGAGPAGYFAALECLEYGFTPIVLERGKDVRSRRKDLRAIQQYAEVGIHSNYCFGEGGAGTYSDGKLYTRSHKRGSIEKVLRLLVEHGATEDILVDTHPHIGSNKLWLVVQKIRETIEQHGGEVHFDTHVVDIEIDASRTARSVVCANGLVFDGDAIVLATGHSARDIYDLCVRRDITIQAKAFALGVRIEHPQELVDEIQYHHTPRDPYLQAASYKLVCQSGNRGVFSFCMCPGGLIVPSATQPGEIVVNGMSMSKRDSPYANSGTVVAVEEEDWQPYLAHYGERAGLALQANAEQAAFASVGDGSQKAPAQRLTDYLSKRVSTTLPNSSYIPGMVSRNMQEILPSFVDTRLRDAIVQFERSMPGYITNEAVLVGVESRTSSPVRIPRNKETLEHIHVSRLFPCGEGAGYAGGIVSAALDGQNVVAAIRARIFSAA